MRGALRSGPTLVPIPWIIPAYAGSTIQEGCNGLKGRDHPRVCGEHFQVCISKGSSFGSSPRMRGAPEKAEEIPVIVRIIPAYAGSTA